MNVADVRSAFVKLFHRQEWVVDKTGCKMIEIAPADFDANENHIFGKVNEDYVSREIAWYESMSLSVHDIPGGTPKEWLKTADKNGVINSNYGWMAFSDANFGQYDRVFQELKNNPSSRRTCMVYMRPSMWVDYNANGRSDFCCTWGHTFHIRNDRLNVIVNMRSNDGWAGYRNDRAWARYVQIKLAEDLKVVPGKVWWHADSLHFYEHQFYLIDHYERTGQTSIPRNEYRQLYPGSPWSGIEERNADT